MNRRPTRWSALLLALLVLSGCSKASKTATDMGGDLAGQLTGLFGDASSVLGSITDEASAQEAVPQIESINSSLDQLSTEAASASPAEQSSLSEVATSQIPGLREVTDTIYQIPGVKPVVQPPLDSMLSKFSSFM